MITKKQLASLGFRTSRGQHRRPQMERVHKQNQRLSLPEGREFSIWGTSGYFLDPNYIPLRNPSIELGRLKLPQFIRLVAELRRGAWPIVGRTPEEERSETVPTATPDAN